MSNLTPVQIFVPVAAVLLGLTYLALVIIDKSSGQTTTIVESESGEDAKSTTTTVVKPDLDLGFARFVVGLLAVLAVFASFTAYGSSL